MRRRFPYEAWHALHLATYLAIFLVFWHQLSDGADFVANPSAQLAWYALYGGVAAALAWYRFVVPVRRALRHNLRVAGVTQEAPGVVSVYLTGDHLDELGAEPGQFFRWRFLTPDHWGNAHPFSLSAAPTATTLRLTVKALGDGSRDLQALPVGTWVIAEGPFGAVTSARRTHRNVLLIAGGVGITPMRALFESLPLAPGEDLLLLYRARTPDELLFRRELDAIAAQRGARVGYLLGPDREPLSAGGLRRMVPDLAQRDVYMCGSPGLTDAVRRSLREAGLPPEQLHEERFDF
jgi:ferredoxin-NADP reductase